MSYDVEIIKCKTALNVDIVYNKLYASINPYLGCENQCRYCYVQAEKYSKTNDLSVVKVKYNIIDVLLKDIARYNGEYPFGVVYLGTSSDPYQSKEKKYLMSQKILYLILNHTSYNIHIFTKSSFVLNDIEIFKKFKERINISITLITTEEKIKEIFEPNADHIQERLNCIKKLNLEGVSCGCSIMPVLPYITDSPKKLESLFYNLKQHNCRYIWWGYLTLRNNLTDIKKQSQKEIYYNILSKYFPEIIDKYNLLYKQRTLPNKTYQRFVNNIIVSLAKKYSLHYLGPKWRYQGFSQQLFLNLKY